MRVPASAAYRSDTIPAIVKNDSRNRSVGVCELACNSVALAQEGFQIRERLPLRRRARLRTDVGDQLLQRFPRFAQAGGSHGFDHSLYAHTHWPRSSILRSRAKSRLVRGPRVPEYADALGGLSRGHRTAVALPGRPRSPFPDRHTIVSASVLRDRSQEIVTSPSQRASPVILGDDA